MKKYLLALIICFQSFLAYADSSTIYYKVEIKSPEKLYLEGGLFSNKNNEEFKLHILNEEDSYNFCLTDKCVLSNNTDGNISVIAIKINSLEYGENEEIYVDFNLYSSLANYSIALDENQTDSNYDISTYKYFGKSKVKMGEAIVLEIPPNKISNDMQIIITPYY